MKLFSRERSTAFNVVICIILSLVGFIVSLQSVSAKIFILSVLSYSCGMLIIIVPLYWKNVEHSQTNALSYAKEIKKLLLIDVALGFVTIFCGSIFWWDYSQRSKEWLTFWPLCWEVTIWYLSALISFIAITFIGFTKMKKNNEQFFKRHSTFSPIKKAPQSDKNMALLENVLPKNTISVISPLFEAILKQDVLSVRNEIIKNPEQLNTAYAQNGNTPLHVATLNGYTDIVCLLLKQPGIDTTCTNNEEKTALDLAREKGFIEIIQLLENKHD